LIRQPQDRPDFVIVISECEAVRILDFGPIQEKTWEVAQQPNCYSSKMFLVLFAPLRRSSSLWSLMKSHSQIAGIMNKVKKRNASISTPFFRVGSRFGIRISLISTSKYLIKTIGVSRLTTGGI
jgi:hypothetical protein